MWLRHTSLNERRVMVAAYAGYGLDGCYAVVVTSAWVLPETRGRVLSVEAGVTA